MQGLQVRRKHQVEEWKVEGTIGFLISFVICCLFFIGGMGEGEGGGSTFDGFIVFIIRFRRWTGLGGTHVRPLTGWALRASGAIF
jgi:hypothetical protein